MKLPLRLRALALLLGSAVLLAGCAIHQNQQGGYVFNMDLPEVLGTVMDKHPLPDGQSEVSLRKMGSEWSLKFGLFSRVVRLPQLTGGRIVDVSRVGNATNILLNTRTAQCDSQYLLVSVNQHSEASVWPLDMPCNYPAPDVKTGHTEQFLDFIVGQRVTRYIYRAGKLTRNRDVVLPPGAVLPKPVGQPAGSGVGVERRPYAPRLPFTPSLQERQQRPAGHTTAAHRPAPSPTPPKPPKDHGTPTSAEPPKQSRIDWGKEEAVSPGYVVDLRNP